MQRRPTPQDITWLLDLNIHKQLDLDPPYQRRSVWTKKDKQFFLDTIFRNFPSPPIFLHKTISEDGRATYHVVDGKQRTQTIIDFVNDKIRISKEFGDKRLDGKKWSDLQSENDLKQKLWNYQLTVEQIDFSEDDLVVVNDIFDRLNRNARKLARQELRHAKFEGWLISLAESESDREEWREFGVVTNTRAKRMADSQFISELLLVLLENKIMGFDQDTLDEMYAKYDDIEDTDIPINEEEFKERFENIKKYITEIQKHSGSVAKYANTLFNFYTLWTTISLNKALPVADKFAEQYQTFMSHVQELSQQSDFAEFFKTHQEEEYKQAMLYLTNSRGASTDQTPRENRHQALTTAIVV